MTVAGAGVLGLSTALRLAEAGAQVLVCDRAAWADNASGVAAGMLAPALETVLDAGGGGAPELLLAARDLWPGRLAAIGYEDGLDRSGALMVGREAEAAALEALAARMRALGWSPEPLSQQDLHALHPDLAVEARLGWRTREDWRLSPTETLARLAAALEALGGRLVRAPLTLGPAGARIAGEPAPGTLVVATGAEAADLAGLVPELAALSPIKGQILHFRTGPHAGPVVRTLHGYVVPQAAGAVAGATMELGRNDRALDPEVLARLRGQAATAFPHLAEAAAEGRAAVRAATPDGLPLVGASRAGPDLVLCTGARRNGWLLAPLAAEVVLRTLAGEDPGPAGAAFDPRRFG